MEFQVETQVAVHQLQRIVDRCDDTVYLAVRVCPGVHLEHLSESGIGVGTGAMAGFFQSDRHMVVERNQLHVVLEYVHDLLQIIGVPQWKREQNVVAVKLRFLHCRHIKKLWHLQGYERHEVIQKVS